jgi:hypothetical protein
MNTFGDNFTNLRDTSSIILLLLILEIVYLFTEIFVPGTRILGS